MPKHCRELASSRWRNEEDCDCSRLEFWCKNRGITPRSSVSQSLKQQHNIISDVLEEAFRTKCMSTGQVRINMLIFDPECQQAHHTQRTLAIEYLLFETSHGESLSLTHGIKLIIIMHARGEEE